MPSPLISSLNTSVALPIEIKKTLEYLAQQELEAEIKEYILNLKALIQDFANFISGNSNISREEFEKKFNDFAKISPSSMPPELYKECEKAIANLEKALTPEEKAKKKEQEDKQGELIFNPFGLNSSSEKPSALSDNSKKGSSKSPKEKPLTELKLPRIL